MKYENLLNIRPVDKKVKLPLLQDNEANVSSVIPSLFAMKKGQRSKCQLPNLLRDSVPRVLKSNRKS